MNEGSAETTTSLPKLKAPTSADATRRLTVEVQDDHLKSLCGTRSPLDSVAELIWNSLDADASHVRVSFKENGLGGLDEVIITDDGHGIPHETALTSFGSLGGSWKPQRGKSPKGLLVSIRGVIVTCTRPSSPHIPRPVRSGRDSSRRGVPATLPRGSAAATGRSARPVSPDAIPA